MTDALLEVSGLGKTLISAAGGATLVNHDITMSVGRGEFVAIVGPSGAGKTTLLRSVSGLISPDSGTVSHRGRPVQGVPDWLSIVFQEYNKTLFPWLSVERNVAMAIRDQPRKVAAERVATALESVGLPDVASKYPWELSGGMQQRVAIARAMVCEPELVLMDEPFASVDALTRSKLEDVVMGLWQQSGFGALLVTHDIGEAVYLSDRVLVLSARPSTIIAEIVIDLPRPRTQVQTRSQGRFLELHHEILDLVEDASAPREVAHA